MGRTSLFLLFGCLCLSVSPCLCPCSLRLSTPCCVSALSPALTTAHPLSRQGSAGPAWLPGLGAAAAVPSLGAGAVGAALLLGAGAGARVGTLRGAGQGGARPHPAGAGPARVGGARQRRRRGRQQRGLRGPFQCLWLPHTPAKPPTGPRESAVELGSPHPEPN